MSARKLKKSETLEIRLPYPTKQAFMARCQAEGVSASEALRGFIDDRIAPSARRRMPHLVVGALIAAAVGAVAVPSLAGPSLTAGLVSRLAFERLDTNHDGVISYAEFKAARDAAR